MATYIFGGLTAAVLALSIFMGIRNSAEFEEQLAHREKSERRLKTSQSDLEDLRSKKAETIASLESSQAEDLVEKENLEAVIAEVATLEGNIKEKESTVDSNKAAIATNDELLVDLPDPELLVPQITATKNKIAQLKADIARDGEAIENLKSQVQGVDAQVANKRALVESQSSGKSLATLSTSVKSVYGNWGFVTLNGGNANGVVPDSVLDVLRNGEVVAKLKVTTVEQNRAAADIMVDALPVVATLRSGDRVVAEKVSE